MTNKEEEKDLQCDPRVAALLAVHLVSQVLDEAYVIANAAKDSGQPWRFVSSFKKFRSSRLNEIFDKDVTFTVSKDGKEYGNNHRATNVSNEVVTSTPQKTKDHMMKTRNAFNIIGQGDEDIELSNSELRKSTSMFINHLFDMSDVEDTTVYTEPDISSFNSKEQTRYNESNVLIIEIIESYIDIAFNIICEREDRGDETQTNYCKLDSTENSSYSLLSDAFDISKDMITNLNDGRIQIPTSKDDKNHHAHLTTEQSALEIKENEEKTKKDIAMYENAYLTLNRDYEQCSEEDVPVLQDSKVPLQEVELLTPNTSSENVTRHNDKKEEIESGTVASAAGSRKSTLVHRCRIQGSRLLSCLKGWWWRRKLFGKRKEPRVPRSIRDLINPLSPDARRRTASLIDQRKMRTPSPSSCVIWKFNTVNEALVHSSRWKEFGIKMSLNENDEF